MDAFPRWKTSRTREFFSMSLYNTESIHIQKLSFTQDPLYQFYPDWLSCQVQYPLLSLLVTNEYPKDTLTQWNRNQERLLATRIGTKAIIGISYSNTNQEERFSPSLTWDLENQESKNIHVQKINQLLERQKIITCRKKKISCWKDSKNASFWSCCQT